MKQTIDESLFIQAFENYNRVNNFGYPGLRALFEYLESGEDEENQMELDVVALCCDYAQYDTVQEAMSEYGLDTIEELQDNTTVILYDVYGQDEQSVIIQSF